MTKARATTIWLLLAAVVIVPIALAANSPQLEWRDPVYIAAGFAGIIALALLLAQPLLAGDLLPNLSMRQRRLAHRWVGASLVVAIIVHVGALWITSPPDVIDALLFVSPTQFSLWGVIAMWAVFAAGLLAAFRKRLKLRWLAWRLAHTSLATITVAGSIAHALLIDGTMEFYTKVGLSVLVGLATAKVMFDLRVWVLRSRHSKQSASS